MAAATTMAMPLAPSLSITTKSPNNLSFARTTTPLQVTQSIRPLSFFLFYFGSLIWSEGITSNTFAAAGQGREADHPLRPCGRRGDTQQQKDRVLAAVHPRRRPDDGEADTGRPRRAEQGHEGAVRGGALRAP